MDSFWGEGQQGHVLAVAVDATGAPTVVRTRLARLSDGITIVFNFHCDTRLKGDGFGRDSREGREAVVIWIALDDWREVWIALL